MPPSPTRAWRRSGSSASVGNMSPRGLGYIISSPPSWALRGKGIAKRVPATLLEVHVCPELGVHFKMLPVAGVPPPLSFSAYEITSTPTELLPGILLIVFVENGSI